MAGANAGEDGQEDADCDDVNKLLFSAVVQAWLVKVLIPKLSSNYAGSSLSKIHYISLPSTKIPIIYFINIDKFLKKYYEENL